MTRFFMIAALLLAMHFCPVIAEAVLSCPGCNYRVYSETIECPKCLKLLKWPFVPERTRRGRVVVRTGTDAFIRDRHSQNRDFRYDRNAGRDKSGPVGSWGGPTTLRYLLRFDVAEAFALAKVDLSSFEFRRATLKISVTDAGSLKGALPVRIYPLSRYFQEGRGEIGIRDKEIDGCTWVYAAPLMVWHQEGGDYLENPSSKGTIPTSGHVLIDVSDIFRHRFAELKETGKWNDPGMIIMRDPYAYGDLGYINIYSFESRAVKGLVRAPELFIE